MNKEVGGWVFALIVIIAVFLIGFTLRPVADRYDAALEAKAEAKEAREAKLDKLVASDLAALADCRSCGKCGVMMTPDSNERIGTRFTSEGGAVPIYNSHVNCKSCRMVGCDYWNLMAKQRDFIECSGCGVLYKHTTSSKSTKLHCKACVLDGTSTNSLFLISAGASFTTLNSNACIQIYQRGYIND